MAKNTNRIQTAHLNKPYLIITAIFALVAVGALKVKAAERPNILYFYVDDMGWGAIGPNGQAARKAAGKPYVQTPNLDRLASQGINFTRGYGCHVCSPARSSQQTGFHQGHTFADRNDPNNAKKAMRRDDLCIGDVLSAAGYTTGYWGKWGYGGSATMTAPVIENVQTLPTSHGYQHVLAELHHVRAHTFFQPTLWSAPASKKVKGGIELIPNSMAAYQNDRYPNTPAYQSHAKYPKTAYCDDCYSMAALDFVRKQGMNYNKTGQPFCGILAAQIPHAPFDDVATLPNWDKAYADDPHFTKLAKQTQQWAAMVTRIDAHFGNILAALDDPNGDGDTSDSIADNTLVIFQSDNGGPGGANNKELDANGGLRGTKGNIQEGGIRVPLIMRWPAKINVGSKLKPGDNCNMVVDVTDLLPTFCELAGVAAPLGIDGVSIAPTLRNSGTQRIREFLIHEAGNGQSIIRGRHKLVRSVVSKKNKKKEEPQTQFKLYDLVADPTESKDISAANPKMFKELQALLIGERVTEPRGFANTYHHWTGKDGANTGEADNWSDYTYENESVIYTTETGAPQVAWTAFMKNTGETANTAHLKKDAEFLGLELQGAAANAKQTLVVKPGVTLTGRNEIRLSAHSVLEVNDGTVASLRWIDVLPNASLTGTGKINATIYNDGTVSVAHATEHQLHIGESYHQTLNGNLELAIHDAAQPAMNVQGQANLAGELSITLPADFKPISGKAYPIIVAKRIVGTFSNPRNEVVASDGSRFTIHYSNSNVTVSK